MFEHEDKCKSFSIIISQIHAQISEHIFRSLFVWIPMLPHPSVAQEPKIAKHALFSGRVGWKFSPLSITEALPNHGDLWAHMLLAQRKEMIGFAFLGCSCWWRNRGEIWVNILWEEWTDEYQAGRIHYSRYDSKLYPGVTFHGKRWVGLVRYTRAE